ncbi:hypothetical protein E4U44_007561 [Claviceps purpurea]|nr:hypothetical protein E4U44_007561 [Claviceps purpurea]
MKRTSAHPPPFSGISRLQVYNTTTIIITTCDSPCPEPNLHDLPTLTSPPESSSPPALSQPPTRRAAPPLPASPPPDGPPPDPLRPLRLDLHLFLERIFLPAIAT